MTNAIDKRMKKILVCGGRHYSNRAFLFLTLDDIKPNFIVSGAAPGADTLAIEYAKDRGIAYDAMPANRNKYGGAAGPIRNKAMLDAHPDIEMVVAFEGGANMLKQAQQLQFKTLVVEDV